MPNFTNPAPGITSGAQTGFAIGSAIKDRKLAAEEKKKGPAKKAKSTIGKKRKQAKAS